MFRFQRRLRHCVSREQNVPVILDAGGINAPLESSFLENISILSPNEQELSLLIGGGSIDTDSEELEEVRVLVPTALVVHSQSILCPGTKATLATSTYREID